MYIYIIFSEEVQIFCTLAQRKGISHICPFFHCILCFPKRTVGEDNCSGKVLSKFQWMKLTYIITSTDTDIHRDMKCCP